MRTALFAEELYNRGHRITWWGSTFYHQCKQLLYRRKVDIKWKDNYIIKLLHGGTYRSNVSIKRYFYHKAIANRFSILARFEEKPDIIIVSLPTHDLAYEAVKYATEHGVPVVVDVRDLWPDYFVELLPKLMRPVVRKLLSSDFKKTSDALSGATGIVAVSETYLKWALSYANRGRTEKDNVFYIGCQNIDNEVASYDTATELKHTFRIPDDKVLVTFIGTFGETYDFQTVVDAARELEVRELSNIHFVLAGDGQNFERIKSQVIGLSNVTLPGWLDKKQVEQLLKISDVGIAPYKANAPQSLPNKPFQYAGAGIPIVTSLSGELKTMLQEYKAGINFDAGDKMSLLNLLMDLSDDAKLRKLMGCNALKLFRECFDAREIYQAYGTYLENIAQKRSAL